MKRRMWYGSALILIVAALILGGVQRLVRPDATAAFWSAIDTNLSTNSVTRTISANTGGQKISQYTQLQLGRTPLSHSLTVVSGTSGTVQAEEISDQKTDMVRYRSITTTQKTADGQPLDFSAVTGRWARLATGVQASGFTSGLFDASLLGIIPFGNLPAETRQELIDYARDQQVFSFDAGKVSHTNNNGRSEYVYDVTVRPAAYVSFMQRYGKLVGATEFAGQDANDYQTAAAIPLTVRINPVSRQLVSITQTNTKQVETYSGYGAQTMTAIPNQQVSLNELQSRLAAVRR